jgi:hypothetical protein
MGYQVQGELSQRCSSVGVEQGSDYQRLVDVAHPHPVLNEIG